MGVSQINFRSKWGHCPPALLTVCVLAADDYNDMAAEEDDVPMVTYDEHTSVFHITVPITADMAPQAQLLVYYVRPDGETVADSYMMKVDKCVNNPVRWVTLVFILFSFLTFFSALIFSKICHRI